MKKLVGLACLLALLSGSGQVAADSSPEDAHSGHMVAEAMLTAHFIAAALEAGMGRDEINAALSDIAERSAIDEFWVSDEEGRVVFTNTGVDFAFPTDPEAGTQAAPFAALLDGSKSVVIQGPREREYDSKVFRYVGVAGVDRPRIVQVGIAAPEPETR